ncbi:hypothetical protein CVU82_01695 [Candidatus Falkowbacteria bacterium HGW-Falkowbacteria-1]|uniref:Uncharacterized protein n=1 Tax=Candidatus Falkowbacteria bacterium HGW-Falkowbacteria-1 TaxID=2013768 RepID=A0A2N2E981_9BACT|nr:MAG: hypothetical protein CVU82_01695 [Candidatus Falkowbacteria bacterium HGW-Falkowbacteria-1]
MINLDERRLDIISVATKAFEIITRIPNDVRKDDKERTGIQVLVRQPGTRNLVFVSIKEPSEAAKFFSAEKAVRSDLRFEMTSQESEDPKKLQFPGSVMIEVEDGHFLQASISGLQSEEDVAVAIAILSSLLSTIPSDLCERIRAQGGELPSCFEEEGHYLYEKEINSLVWPFM